MTNDKNIIFHIGVGKSGTTTLQENVFNSLPDIACLGRPNHDHPLFRDLSYGLCLAEDGELDRLILPFIEYASSFNQPTIVVSDENLQTQPVSLVASRISKYFPEAIILISLRNQLDAIKSHYSNEGRVPKGPRSENSLFVPARSYLDYYLRHPSEGFFRSLDYLGLVDTVSRYFRPEQLKIVLFEELVNEPDRFAQEIAGLLSVAISEVLDLLNQAPKNKRDSQRILRYQSLRQKIPIRSLRQLFLIPPSLATKIEQALRRGSPASIEFSDADIESLTKLFGPRNSALAERFDLPFEQYNYLGYR